MFTLKRIRVDGSDGVSGLERSSGRPALSYLCFLHFFAVWAERCLCFLHFFLVATGGAPEVGG